MTTSVECIVFRCRKQEEMYLYLRADLNTAELPHALLKMTGHLTPVMNLDLAPARKLARVDVAQVIGALRETGYFLQMPPDGRIKAHLYSGD